MHENMLTSKVRTWAIMSVLAKLINKFGCICARRDGYYNVMVIIKIKIFHNCRCQIILRWQSKELHDHVWLVVPPTQTHSFDNEISIILLWFQWRHVQRYSTIIFSSSNCLERNAITSTKMERIPAFFKNHMNTGKSTRCLIFPLTLSRCRGLASFVYRNTFPRRSGYIALWNASTL